MLITVSTSIGNLRDKSWAEKDKSPLSLLYLCLILCMKE
ncbi:hypothetical protein M2133_001836 [Parabacteroides sp. PF5-6]|nr:hypothetical protein [Parabacteroides sp. PF5-6]